MADIQNQKYGDLYTNLYPYQKNFYNISTIPSTETYRGTVEIPAGLTQKGTGTYPLVHAKDVQIGNKESDRLNDKLADYDIILRELYGRTPAQLEALTDGRTAERITELEADNGVRGANGTAGIQSLSRVADVLNNRTETIDDRLLDLRAIKTVTFGAESELATNPTGNKDTIIADNNGDTITVTPSNKWVKIFSSAADDSFTIGHLVQAITDNTGSTDFNTANVTETFDVDTFTFDEAGHVRSRHKHTYTMPKNFKEIVVAAAAIPEVVTNTVGHVQGSCVADNLTDILTLYAGNKWINIAANRAGTNTQTQDTNDCITFSHIISTLAAEEHRLEYVTTAQTPSFGSTFDIPKPMYSFTTDEAGHVTAYSSSASTVTVKIPQPSLTDAQASGSDVITQLTLTASSGALSTTRTNIGLLTLTGYQPLNNVSETITASDSLNTAIAKLQKEIEDEAVARNTAIVGLYGETLPATNALTLVGLNTSINDTNTLIANLYGSEIPSQDYLTLIHLNDLINNLYGADPIPTEDYLTLTGLQESIDNLDGTNIMADNTAETPISIVELAGQKLNNTDFDDFKLMYNNLIDKLGTDLNWDMDDPDIIALKFTIPTEEEQTEPDPNAGE